MISTERELQEEYILQNYIACKTANSDINNKYLMAVPYNVYTNSRLSISSKKVLFAYLLKHKANDDHIHWLICTTLNKNHKYYLTREKQIKQVSKSFNFNSVHTLPYETTKVDHYNMSEIIEQIPKTYQSPTMAPFCEDKEKYNVVNDVLTEIKKLKDKKIKIDNQEIKEILTVNGVRFSFEDGSWGLIRASSNNPSLVVVTESPSSNERKIEIFKFIDSLLQRTKKIGEYDQKI